MSDREEGYEIDNTTGGWKVVPVVSLVFFLAVLVIWRFIL